MKKSVVKKERLLWIDLAKFVAIVAVIIGHLFGIIYTNQGITGYVAYSVTLFIILAGYNSAFHLINFQISSKFNWLYLWSRLKKILIPYFIATLIYHLYSSGYYFELPKFLEHLLLFNSRPPFYYIFIYIQLLVIAYFIIKIISNKKLFFQLIILFLIYQISVLFTTRTNTLNLYGGGSRLLGGTYFFAFSIGVFLFDRLNLIKGKFLFILGIITLLLFVYFQNEKMYASTFSNPPNNALIFYSLIILLFIYVIGNYLAKSPLVIFFKPLAFLGRYSLYIYLYHILAIEITTEIIIKNGWIDKAIQNYFYVLFALLFPVFIIKIYELIVFLAKTKTIKRLF